MECPVCRKLMWDNRGKKKNPKAPDFRCKDENCKYTFNRDTEEYEEGEYQTAVWIEKEVEKLEEQMQQDLKQEVKKSVAPKPEKTLYDNTLKSTLMSYSKDLVCAQIASGKYSEPLGIEDVIHNYKQMVSNL